MCIRDSTHAVSGQPDFTRRCIVVDDRFHVAQMFGEKVRAVQPLGRPEAAPVGGDDVPVALQFIDDELAGGGHVHPAVQQEQLSLIHI